MRYDMSMTRRRPALANTFVAYLRVSTEEQAESGAGLDAQKAVIEAKAAQRGWTIVAWYVDAGVSGKSLDRPELTKALADVRSRRASGLVTAKLDRLSRSLKDFAGLLETAQREKWTLAVLDTDMDMSTPAGEFMANVMASAALYERRLISQRTKDGLAAKRAQGVRLGRTRLLSDEVIRRILDERADGRSFQKIADGLNADGIATAQKPGAKWHAMTVHHVTTSQDGVAMAKEQQNNV